MFDLFRLLVRSDVVGVSGVVVGVLAAGTLGTIGFFFTVLLVPPSHARMMEDTFSIPSHAWTMKDTFSIQVALAPSVLRRRSMLPLEENILVLEVHGAKIQDRREGLRHILEAIETIAQSPPIGVNFVAGPLSVKRYDDGRWLELTFTDTYLYDGSKWTISIQIISGDLLSRSDELPGRVVFRLRGALRGSY